MIMKTYEDCLRVAGLLGVPLLDAEHIAAAHGIEFPDEEISELDLRKFLGSLDIGESDARAALVLLRLADSQPDLPAIAVADAREGSDLLLGELLESGGPRQDIAAEAITLPVKLSGMEDVELREFLGWALDEHRNGDFISPSHDLAIVRVDAALRELCRRLPEPA